MMQEGGSQGRRHNARTIGRRLVVFIVCVACLAGIVASASSGSHSATLAAKAKPQPKWPTKPVPLVPNPKLHAKVYILWPNTTTPAYPLYTIPSIVNAFKKYLPNVKLVQYVGNNDQATQLTQVEAAITGKADVVIYAPVVPTEAGAGLDELHKAKIPVIALRQDPDGGPVDSYIWVDFNSVGKYWGNFIAQNLVKNVGHTPVRLAEILGDPSFSVYQRWVQGVTPALNALVASGKVQIVCKADTVGFNPALAQSNMDQCLTQTGNNIDAVLVMQDSTGDGIAASLASHGLLGKVKMYGGHDADVQTLDRVLLGQQFGTFHPDGKATGLAAVALTQAELLHKPPRSTGYINGVFLNGFYPYGVPTYFATETLVTAANMQQTIVKDGFLTKAQICTPSVASTPFCKAP